MRSLLLSSILAVTVSCAAYAKPSSKPNPPPKDASCVTLDQINNGFAAREMKEVFEPAPQALFELFAARGLLPKTAKSMAAIVTDAGMVVAPMDDKGCVLGAGAISKADLNELLNKSAPPAATKPPAGEDQADSDHV